MHELPVKEALVIHPGDHLLVRCDHDLNPEEVAWLKERINAELPALSGVTILVGVEGLAVFREADNA